MTEVDYGTFERAFQRVCGAFRLRLKPIELQDLCRTYYRVLEAHPLDEVMNAGKSCISSSRTFPKAADWLAQLSVGEQVRLPMDRRVMTIHEVAELAEAERMRYVGNLCLCSECCRAGVDDREIRFVPSLVGDEEERAFHPTRKLVIVVGHWAHGEELQRWYQARDLFYAASKRAGVPVGRLGFVYTPPAHAPHRPELVASREPGEEGLT